MHTIQTIQKLPIDIDRAWAFFSSPANLREITPAYMSFRITSEMPAEIYPGLIITYKLNPAPGVRITWVTEITHSERGKYFVDEQRFGPYKFWHHKHFFREIKNGTEMTDIVHYKLPLGILGSAAHGLFVRRQLTGIFNYRFNKLNELFGEYK